MWVQINLETNCKVSISEYPAGESYFCSRVWEGTGECQLPEPPAPRERVIRAGAWHSAIGPCTASRALVQSRVLASCSWGTSHFFFLQKRFRRARSRLLCFYHLSNNFTRQRRFLDLSSHLKSHCASEEQLKNPAEKLANK